MERLTVNQDVAGSSPARAANFKGDFMPNGKYQHRFNPLHHKAYGDGSVYEHVLIAEEKLGRRLSEDETVHHIDGDKQNNVQANILVFSTNAAHTTFHHGGKLIFNEDGTVSCSSTRIKTCAKCGKTFKGDRGKTKYCSPECRIIGARVVMRPSAEELKALTKEYNFLQLGKMFGVSDNAVRKWCKNYGIPYKYKDLRGE